MKKFFKRQTEERDRKKKVEIERGVLRGGNTRASTLEGPLLDPRGMKTRRGINSTLTVDYDPSSSLMNADVVLVGPAASISETSASQFMGESQNNLGLANSSSQDSSLLLSRSVSNDAQQQQQQQQQRSTSDNSEYYSCHGRTSSVISDVTTSTAGSAYEDIIGKPKRLTTREERDKRTKQLIREQQQRATSTSELSVRSAPSSNKVDNNSERLTRDNSERLTQAERDKRTKEAIKQQRAAASSSSLTSSVTGGQRVVSSSSSIKSNFSERLLTQAERDKRTKEAIKQQRAAASSSSLTSSVTGGQRVVSSSSSIESNFSERLLTQAERDKRTKEAIKQQRAAASSSSLTSSVTGGQRVVSSSSSVNSSFSERLLTQAERDKRTKERIKQQRAAASSSSLTSSPGGLSSVASFSSNNSGDSRRLSQEEEDKRTKERIKQERAAVASSLTSSFTGGHRSFTSSTANSGHSRRLSQEEEDKRTKERIKQERAAAASSFTSSTTGSVTSSTANSGNSRRLSQEEEDKRTKELIKQERERNAQRAALTSYSLKSLSEEGGESGGDDDREVSGSSSKREGSEGLCSVLKGKGKQRYSGVGRRKNIDGEVEGRSVSFADIANDEKGRGCSSDDEESKQEDGLDESERSDMDNWDEAIMATARELGGDDYCVEKGDDYYDEDEEELRSRQSHLVDLHISQFMATSQINLTNDFDATELKDIYHRSLEGVEEGDEDELLCLAASKRLDHFEKEEAEKNMKRRKSQRLSKTSVRLAAWHEKHSLRMALKVANRTSEQEWLSSFYRCDPRWQIQSFFDEVAREGGDAQLSEDFAASPLALLFNKANVFTVWRPTSDEAIKNMMLGIATGKGLDIKGKSAKRGNISSYVPFIQIYEEEHKERAREFLKDGRSVLVFYKSEANRNEALEMLLDIKDFMLFAAQDAMRILADEYASEEEQELAMKHLMYDDTNVRVTLVDTYAHSDKPVFGLDITERLFWEGYVMMQDCSRPKGTEWDIGRGSEPTFMDFNFKSIRKNPGIGAPRAVVYQFSEQFPMEPRTLLMAYEEHGMVKPVVSDFDCFLLGSRGVKYSQPIPPDQVELVKWSVKNISEVLDERAASQTDSGWMKNWFEVLKKAALKNYVPITPKYGNGDPKSYEIIEIAVSRLKGTGCVRHGAECFNWYFPQEIDDEFLVISDTLPGSVKWKKMNVFELQECLMTKIDEGFTFPLNPKWVLCDPGWRRVYDKLLASQKPNVQDSINCWLPPETGLREQIDAISKRHPHGFEGRVYKVEGTEVMDKMEEELEHYRRVQALWRKARALVWWIIFLHTKSQMKRLEAYQRLR